MSAFLTRIENSGVCFEFSRVSFNDKNLNARVLETFYSNELLNFEPLTVIENIKNMDYKKGTTHSLFYPYFACERPNFISFDPSCMSPVSRKRNYHASYFAPVLTIIQHITGTDKNLTPESVCPLLVNTVNCKQEMTRKQKKKIFCVPAFLFPFFSAVLHAKIDYDWKKACNQLYTDINDYISGLDAKSSEDIRHMKIELQQVKENYKRCKKIVFLSKKKMTPIFITIEEKPKELKRRKLEEENRILKERNAYLEKANRMLIEFIEYSELK